MRNFQVQRARAAAVLRQKSWIDLALDLVLSEKLTSRKQMNKREAKKRWKIFSTKIAGNYFPVENIFHRADEFSLKVSFVTVCMTLLERPPFYEFPFMRNLFLMKLS